MRSSSLLLLIGLLGASHHALADVASCGELTNAYGPFDYTNSEHRREKLPIVDVNHFTPVVESLQRGQSDAYPGADIDYTLRAFPNHHRALQALMRLAARDKLPKLIKMQFSVECYFDRAVRMNQNDYVSKMLYAQLLDQRGRLDEALALLKDADQVRPDDANIHYNLGLIYFKKKDYALANEYAQKAYGAGFQLPGLREKLKSANKWEAPKPAN